MKFCLITTFFPPMHFGGDAVMVANLASALVRRGHEVDVVHCRDSFDLLRHRQVPSEVPLETGVNVHTLHSGLGRLSPMLTHATGLPTLKRTRLQRILDCGFDVIHWHNFSLIGSPSSFHPKNAIQLCTLHDYWMVCPMHILFRYDHQPCHHPMCHRCCLAQGRPPQFWRRGSLPAKTAASIGRFFAPSQYVIDKLSKSGLHLPLSKLPHFVSPSPLPLREGERSYYLYAGRLIRAKGLQTILPLFRNTRRRLLIAGQGDYEAKLKQLAAGAPNIEFLGVVRQGQTRDLYSGAIATIMPSICEETFGLTALESLHARTPALVSAAGALPEIIRNTGGGVCYRDLPELRTVLDRLDADPEWGRRMGIEGFSRLNCYSEDAYMERYFDVIDELRPSATRST